MMRFGLKYYEILNKEVDVAGTDKRNCFTYNGYHQTNLGLRFKNSKTISPEIHCMTEFSKTRKQINCIYTDWAKMMLSRYQVKRPTAWKWPSMGAKVKTSTSPLPEKRAAGSGSRRKEQPGKHAAAYKARFLQTIRHSPTITANDLNTTGTCRNFSPAITLMTDFSWCQIHLQKKPGKEILCLATKPWCAGRIQNRGHPFLL